MKGWCVILSKKYIVLCVIFLLCVTFYIYHTTRSPHQKSSFNKGIKLTISSKKQTYKEGEVFTVDIRATNLNPRTVTFHRGMFCPSSTLFLTIYEEIQLYYNIQVVESKNRPSIDCVPYRGDYYFLPGQTIYEKILFTPKNNIKPPKKLNIKSLFYSEVSLPISILTDEEAIK